MSILHHFLIDVYALFSDVIPTLNDSSREILGPFLPRAMLICSIIWLERCLRVVVLRVLFFVDMRLPRVFSVADLYCLIVFTLS